MNLRASIYGTSSAMQPPCGGATCYETRIGNRPAPPACYRQGAPAAPCRASKAWSSWRTLSPDKTLPMTAPLTA